MGLNALRVIRAGIEPLPKAVAPAQGKVTPATPLVVKPGTDARTLVTE